MLNNTDLANAVSESIISSDQAKQLKAFSKRTRSNDESPLTQEFETRDEPFRLLRGFRDIFIALGILFFSIGATAVYFYTFGLKLYDIPIVKEWGVLLAGAVLLLIGLAIAEIVTRKLRLPLSSLILSLAIAFWFGLLGVLLFSVIGSLFGGFEKSDYGLQPVVFTISSFAGIALFYLRYRLPFVMLVVAGSLVAFFGASINAASPEFFKENTRLIFGTLGLLVFMAAMSFDLKDRLRISRFSECGFWLHLLAAPLMIHSVLAGSAFNSVNIPLVLTVFVCLTLVALIIDRRALLVSSLIYMTGAFTQIVQTLEFDESLQFAFPILFIGILVILLGLGWSPLRRLIMRFVPFPALKDRLPPVYTGPILPQPEVRT